MFPKRQTFDSPDSQQRDSPRVTRLVVLLFILVAMLHISLRIIYFDGVSASDPLNYIKAAYQRASGDFTLEYHHHMARLGVILPVALSFKAFGVSEFAAVLWPMLCSFGTLLLMFWLSIALAGASAGLIAAALFALQPIDISLATNVLPESILTFMMTSCLYSFYRGYHIDDNRRAIPWLICSGMSIWGAYAAKEAGVLLVPILFTYVIACQQRWDRLFWVVVGVGIFLVPELSYYQFQLGDWLYRLHALEAHHATPEVISSNQDLLRRWFITYPRIILLNPQTAVMSSLIAVGVIYSFRYWRRNLPVLLWFFVAGAYLNFGSSSLSEYTALPAATRYLHAVLVPGLILLGVSASDLWKSSESHLAEESRDEIVALRHGRWSAGYLGILWVSTFVIVLAAILLPLVFAGLSEPGGTELTAQENRQVSKFLASHPRKTVYVDPRSERMLEFLFQYENLDWLKLYPEAQESDTLAVYLSKLDDKALLLYNWREIYSNNAYGLTPASRKLLIELAESGRLKLIGRFQRSPSRLLHAILPLPAFGRDLSEGDGRTLTRLDESRTGTELFRIELTATPSFRTRPERGR